jgi:hypothetical protein
MKQRGNLHSKHERVLMDLILAVQGRMDGGDG